MRMPNSTQRNANPGTLSSESAWRNPGRNRPGNGDAVEGDPMAKIVIRTGEVRRITVDLQTPITDTVRSVTLNRIGFPFRINGPLPMWQWDTVPVWALEDPELVIMGGQPCGYDAEDCKVLYEPWIAVWRRDYDTAICVAELIYLLGGGFIPIAAEGTEIRSVRSRVAGVRYSDHERLSPDLEPIWAEWQARERIAAASKALKRARSASTKKTWGMGTVVTSGFTPE